MNFTLNMLKQAGISFSKADYQAMREIEWKWCMMYPRFQGHADLLAYIGSWLFLEEVSKVKPGLFREELDYSIFHVQWYFSRIPLSKIPYPFDMDEPTKTWVEKLYKTINQFKQYPPITSIDPWGKDRNEAKSYLAVNYLESLAVILMSYRHHELKEPLLSRYLVKKTMVDYLSEQWDDTLAPLDLFAKLYDLNNPVRSIHFDFWAVGEVRRIFHCDS